MNSTVSSVSGQTFWDKQWSFLTSSDGSLICLSHFILIRHTVIINDSSSSNSLPCAFGHVLTQCMHSCLFLSLCNKTWLSSPSGRTENDPRAPDSSDLQTMLVLKRIVFLRKDTHTYNGCVWGKSFRKKSLISFNILNSEFCKHMHCFLKNLFIWFIFFFH